MAVLCVGTATTEDARQVEYSVSAYCEGTIPLENVWDTLDKTHQLELVDSVVRAMEKLQQVDVHSISPSLPGNANLLNSTANWPAKWMGGPSLGYHPDVKHFLDSLLNTGSRGPPTCKLLELNGGVVVASSYDDIGQVELSRADLEKLQSHAVCCHNDIEPRNILITKLSSTPGNERYELTALVDWEMVGFYPFSYEYSLKDLVLGSSNLSLDECHMRFIKALGIIDRSRKRRMVRNVGVRFQAKWIEREQVTMSPDLRQGWVRKFDTKPPKPFTKDDAEIMEQEVLRELGYS
ncbi:Protein kinase-like domain [Ceratocystis lukuohia]|uniref:Protein kinase-like domain n=1 Tax=Ceratocystis lukuohia TaxID=2019550 RepID=A0ABR4MH93_9PEZI